MNYLDGLNIDIGLNLNFVNYICCRVKNFYSYYFEKVSKEKISKEIFYKDISEIDKCYFIPKLKNYKNINYQNPFVNSLFTFNRPYTIQNNSKRFEANKFVEKYFNPNKFLLDNIHYERQYIQNRRTHNNIIGVHCRSSLADHGGVRYMNYELGYDDNPYELYFNEIDSYSIDTDILLCSDSKSVERKFRDRYGDRIITSSFSKSENGESHSKFKTKRYTQNGSLVITKPNKRNRNVMAKETLREIFVFSELPVMICGSSHYSLFASYLNPNSTIHDVYSSFYTTQ